MHYARNLLATVPKAHVEFVAAAFRSIFALGTTTEVEARWDEVADTLAERFPKAAESMRDAKTDVLAFAAFPSGALAQDLVEQPARAAQQGSEAPLERRRDLPQRRRRDPPRSAPCSPTNTTSGPSPAATSPRPRWPSSTSHATLTPTSPQLAG